jgi:hypothetical protein
MHNTLQNKFLPALLKSFSCFHLKTARFQGLQKEDINSVFLPFL